MDVNIQISDHGDIDLIRQDGTRLLTLRHYHVALLYALQTAGIPPGSILISRTLPPAESEWELLSVNIQYLRRLGLVTIGADGKVRLTKQGGRFVGWLLSEWDGCIDYQEQFPLRLHVWNKPPFDAIIQHRRALFP